MSSINRNTFQMTNTSVPTNPRVATFSFNRTLQQISSDRPPSRTAVSYDDIEMDSTANPRMSVSRPDRPEPQTNTFGSNTFGSFSQSNQMNLFGNRPQVIPNTLTTNSSIGLKSDSEVKGSDDNYSKSSDLTENDIKQFESNCFAFKSIPVCPPTQSLCF